LAFHKRRAEYNLSDDSAKGITVISALIGRFVKLLARVACNAFFRRIEVADADRVPDEVPIVYVANHFNTLVDPLLILGFLPRRTTFLATSTLWKNPLLRPFLTLGGVVPVFRRQDPDFSPEKNEETFARCREALARGRSIGIFPEGRSHDEPAIQPMKTGAARIVLGTEPQHKGLGIRIVPVGFTFDAKTVFRSRVLVKVGQPINPLDGIAEPDPENHDDVVSLTERIGAALERVTLNYSSWEEARFVKRAADLYMRHSAKMPERPDLSDEFPLTRAFARGYEELREAEPERVAAVVRSVRRYDRMLAISSLRDEQIISGYPKAIVAIYLFRTIFLLLVRLPLTIIGTALNAVPYYVSRWASRFDVARARASIAILTGIVFFPLVWLIEALWAGHKWGANAGWIVTLLGPVSAISAVQFFEKWRSFVIEVRAYLFLRTHDRVREELRRHRETVAGQVAELIERQR
jgi:1-acyl-sn-glycerol-3-phosphate acyltransferase